MATVIAYVDGFNLYHGLQPFTLAAADIRNSLLPEVVADPATGLVLKRPGKWR